MKDSPKISATGTNKFNVGFTEVGLLAHWIGGNSDHSDQYPGYTKEQYAEEALALVQSGTDENISGYKNRRGQVVRYDANNNNFVKGHPDHGIATMFKPAGKAEYYEMMMLLEEREGDDG